MAVLVLLAIATVAWGAFIIKSRSKWKAVVYNGKSLEALFYGHRTNVFSVQTKNDAWLAFLSLGTNGFPFLLANLKESRGDSILYFKTYLSLPTWIQRKLRYPILSDDIKMHSWDYAGWVHDLTEEQIEELCECVTKMENPRVRFFALNSIAPLYGTYPAYFALCRKLLDDPNPAIRLKAAIRLAQRPKHFQKREPRLFPILADGLKSKERRRSSIEISHYNFGQIPPGGKGMVSRNLGGGVFDPDADLRKTIIEAINGLKVVTPEQIEQLRQILSSEPTQSKSPE